MKYKKAAFWRPFCLVHRKGLVTLWCRSVKPSRAALTRTAFYGSSPFLHKNKKQIPEWVSAFYGTPEGTRTPNPRNRNPMLYPLSHLCICLTAYVL